MPAFSGLPSLFINLTRGLGRRFEIQMGAFSSLLLLDVGPLFVFFPFPSGGVLFLQ